MEYSLIFIGGLLGSSHCIGMCGGFAIAIGTGAQAPTQNTIRQLIYSVGRIFTYAFLGAIAGFAGSSLLKHAGTLINVSAFLSITAGGLLLWQGLTILGWRPGTTTITGQVPCLTGGLLKTFLLSPRRWETFIAGVLTGFLPCGLVYAFLTFAAASGNMFIGAAVMAVFGMGTVPLMVLSGLSVSALSLHRRQQLYRAAAVVVILTGALTIARGVTFASSPQSESSVSCPFCLTNTNPQSP